jgi:hypothetical protein
MPLGWFGPLELVGGLTQIGFAVRRTMVHGNDLFFKNASNAIS